MCRGWSHATEPAPGIPHISSSKWPSGFKSLPFVAVAQRLSQGPRFKLILAHKLHSVKSRFVFASVEETVEFSEV